VLANDTLQNFSFCGKFSSVEMGLKIHVVLEIFFQNPHYMKIQFSYKIAISILWIKYGNSMEIVWIYYGYTMDIVWI
jgi:hypothetical protein